MITLMIKCRATSPRPKAIRPAMIKPIMAAVIWIISIVVPVRLNAVSGVGGLLLADHVPPPDKSDGENGYRGVFDHFATR